MKTIVMRRVNCTRVLLVLVVALAPLLLLPVRSDANPIPTTFYASDRDANLYGIIVKRSSSGDWTSWYLRELCRLPTHTDPGATEIEYKEETSQGIVQGWGLLLAPLGN